MSSNIIFDYLQAVTPKFAQNTQKPCFIARKFLISPENNNIKHKRSKIMSVTPCRRNRKYLFLVGSGWDSATYKTQGGKSFTGEYFHLQEEWHEALLIEKSKFWLLNALQQSRVQWEPMGKMNQWYNRSYSVSFARLWGGGREGSGKRSRGQRR